MLPVKREQASQAASRRSSLFWRVPLPREGMLQRTRFKRGLGVIWLLLCTSCPRDYPLRQKAALEVARFLSAWGSFDNRRIGFSGRVSRLAGLILFFRSFFFLLDDRYLRRKVLNWNLCFNRRFGLVLHVGSSSTGEKAIIFYLTNCQLCARVLKISPSEWFQSSTSISPQFTLLSLSKRDT